MIHYYGTPIGGKREDASRFFRGRHALIPWQRSEDLEVVAAVAQSFVFDNSAFSAWRSGSPIRDWVPYYSWVGKWKNHPGFDWAIIPDVIDGDETQNDALIFEWCKFIGPRCHSIGVPVWHLHESIDRLRNLCDEWPRVALGSSGEWPTPNRPKWWRRMGEAMRAVCDMHGQPRAKLHGLRMLNPEVFTRLPLASADSTNIAQNAARKAQQLRCSVRHARAIMLDECEFHNSAARWDAKEEVELQAELFSLS